MTLIRRSGDDTTVDDPDLSTARIRRDPFLRNFYADNLHAMVRSLELAGTAAPSVVEIGAAGGITKDVFPWIETTDVRPAAGVDRVVDGAHLPHPSDSLDGIIAKDALHHIPDPYAHFTEVARVLKPGARAVYLEPNWNRLSRTVFRRLHPEPFDDSVESWSRQSDDPMDSNQALAYLVFHRDVAEFRRLYPTLDLLKIGETNGVAFLLSGGVHSRTPIPASWLLRLRRSEEKRPRLLRVSALNTMIIVGKQKPTRGRVQLTG